VFHCDVSMYICIITQLVHPLYFSPSYGDFNSLKNSIVILVQELHQPYSPS
jgi:hypothetical protein